MSILTPVQHDSMKTSGRPSQQDISGGSQLLDYKCTSPGSRIAMGQAGQGHVDAGAPYAKTTSPAGDAPERSQTLYGRSEQQ